VVVLFSWVVLHVSINISKWSYGLWAAGLDRGVGSKSDGRELAQAAKTVAAGERQRRAAAGGGGAHRCTPSRAPGLGLKRRRHLHKVREHARQAGTAVASRKRRSGGSTRRRGLQTPAMSPSCYGARRRRHVTPAGSSPPCTSLGELLDDEAAPAAETESGGGQGFAVACKLGVRGTSLGF
jgi:hypothetical protein